MWMRPRSEAIIRSSVHKSVSPARSTTVQQVRPLAWFCNSRKRQRPEGDWIEPVYQLDIDSVVQDRGIEGSPCSTASDGLPHTPNISRRRTERMSICVKRSAWIPLSRFKSVSSVGSIPCVTLLSYGGSTARSNAVSPCGQLLEDVVTDLRPNIPSKSHKIDIVYWDSKWYSHNNRRLWIFRKAVVIAVQVHVGSADRAFLRSLTACTEGLSVIFFPRGVCKACGDKFVNHRSCTTTIVIGWLTLLRHRLRLVGF